MLLYIITCYDYEEGELTEPGGYPVAVFTNKEEAEYYEEQANKICPGCTEYRVDMRELDKVPSWWKDFGVTPYKEK